MAPNAYFGNPGLTQTKPVLAVIRWFRGNHRRRHLGNLRGVILHSGDLSNLANTFATRACARSAISSINYAFQLKVTVPRSGLKTVV
jgi:hypothetical protein